MKEMAFLFLVVLFTGHLFADVDVANTRSHTREGTGNIILGGDLKLPAAGAWGVDEGKTDSPGQIYLLPSQAAAERMMGKRMAAAERERKNRTGRNQLSVLFAPCREHAIEHEGIGPSSIGEFDQKKYKYVIDRLEKSPWPDAAGTLKAPFVFLVPKVEFKFQENRKWVDSADRKLLGMELHPYLDDGKHWALYTDGRTVREDIDPGRVKEYSLTITPVIKEGAAVESAPTQLAYTILAFLPRKQVGPLSIQLEDRLSDQVIVAKWNPGSPAADPNLVKMFEQARGREWASYLAASDSPVLHSWISTLKKADLRLLGQQDRRRNPRRGNTTSVFGVLGGRAAVRETLQMQALAPDNKAGTNMVPVESIQGVTVKSHPYEEMLKGQDGGRLALAEVVPADRFFVHVAKPEAMMPFLDDGADFLSHLGGSVTGNSIKYYLKARYLERLGLSEKWLKMFLKSGAAKECAIITPDLFFLDNTDITVITRLTKPRLMAPLLKLAGVSGLSANKVVIRKSKTGRSVYWVTNGDLLVVSTRKTELEQVLAMKAGGGKDSLGQTAEFRYMLTQLSPTDNTRVFAYLSDSFIRRLVGPSVKIGQLRRMIAKGQMERLTGAALLAGMDGVAGHTSPATLVKGGYLPDTFPQQDYRLDKKLVARSAVYGTLADPTPLTAVPVETATATEAAAYKRYVENYSRFWRQFFDPIAMRLDDTPDKSLELTTFILPLIDSSIYRQLKEVIAARESGQPLRVPVFSPEPVMSLSMNLKEEAWTEITRDLGQFLMQFVQVSPAILDDLGPSLHMAINDADPVIALGSGDLMGAFGGGGMMRGMDAGAMLAMPIALSVFTRPCTLAIETRNQDRTLSFLRRVGGVSLTGRRRGWDDGFNVQFYRVGEEDAWVYSLDIMGLVKIRFGIEVKEGFLLIRNIPWSSGDHVVGAKTAELCTAALDVYPSACKLQLPGLHAAASEQRGHAALQGAGLLFPLLTSGHADMKNAADVHMDMFGFTPQHPGEGKWLWKDGHVVSTTCGSVNRLKVNKHEEGDTDFGLMKTIQSLKLEMQFEESGLRSKVRWKTR